MKNQDKRHKGTSTRMSSKSPIAPPPRAAIQGRSTKADPTHDASTDSSPEPKVKDKDGEGARLSEKALDSSPTATPTTSKEDEEKIGRLENELRIMEDEFSKELNTFSYKLTNEREKATYWEQKYAKLNEQFQKVDSDLRILKEEVTIQAQHQEDLDRDTHTRISSLVLERDSLQKENWKMRNDNRDKAEEIATLRIQIRGLKDFVNSNTRTDGQVTDEVFGEMMQRLGNGLQNWVITNFRKAKLEIPNAESQAQAYIRQLFPNDSQVAAIAKIYLIQSVLSRLVTDRIFEAYFVGIPQEREVQLQQMDAYLRELGSASSLNQWRSATLGIIRKEASSLHSETERIRSSLIKEVNTVLDGITDVKASDGRDQALSALVNSAIELARLMRVQRAVLKVIMPSIRQENATPFDTTQMEDIGGEDEEILQGRAIRCVTFPGILKQGDENGEQVELTNVIAKARVICMPSQVGEAQ